MPHNLPEGMEKRAVVTPGWTPPAGSRAQTPPAGSDNSPGCKTAAGSPSEPAGPSDEALDDNATRRLADAMARLLK